MARSEFYENLLADMLDCGTKDVELLGNLVEIANKFNAEWIEDWKDLGGDLDVNLLYYVIGRAILREALDELETPDDIWETAMEYFDENVWTNYIDTNLPFIMPLLWESWTTRKEALDIIKRELIKTLELEEEIAERFKE